MTPILAPVCAGLLVVEAVAVELSYAAWPRRILAAFIDYFVISFITTPFLGGAVPRVRDAVTAGNAPASADLTRVLILTLIVTVGYSTAMHSWRGSTLGKMAARTVLVNDDGSKVTAQAAFVRSVAFVTILFASFLVVAPIIVNELRPLWSARRQTWHDALAKTVVVTADSVPEQNLTN